MPRCVGEVVVEVGAEHLRILADDSEAFSIQQNEVTSNQLVREELTEDLS